MKYLAAIITLVAAPAWSVNKCTDAAGKVTYQAAACPQQGGKIVLHNTDHGRRQAKAVRDAGK